MGEETSITVATLAFFTPVFAHFILESLGRRLVRLRRCICFGLLVRVRCDHFFDRACHSGFLCPLLLGGGIEFVWRVRFHVLSLVLGVVLLDECLLCVGGFEIWFEGGSCLLEERLRIHVELEWRWLSWQEWRGLLLWARGVHFKGVSRRVGGRLGRNKLKIKQK